MRTASEVTTGIFSAGFVETREKHRFAARKRPWWELSVNRGVAERFIAPVLSHGGALGKNRRTLYRVRISEMEYFAYIIRSDAFGTYYYGSAEDVEVRLKRHNAGKVRSTKSRRPWILHYKEVFGSRSEAYKRELFFKSVDGYKFLKQQGII